MPRGVVAPLPGPPATYEVGLPAYRPTRSLPMGASAATTSRGISGCDGFVAQADARRIPTNESAVAMRRVCMRPIVAQNEGMIDKRVASVDAAVVDVKDGMTIMIGGFGTAGMPMELVDGLIRQGARDLTIVSNNAGNADTGIALLLKERRVRKVICSFPRQTDSWHFDRVYHAKAVELELVPQGNLAERIRAAGAGIGAFFTPTAFGTLLAEGKETREIGGRNYALEYPIYADFALIKAERADRWGNLVYRKTARNVGPIMASAARCTVAQVQRVVALGELDPEAIVTPGIFVQRVVAIDAPDERTKAQAEA